MTASAALAIGGALNLAFAVFHLFFWRLFDWRRQLPLLTSLNRAVVQVLNLCLTFAIGVFAYVSLVHAHDLRTTSLGRSLTAAIGLFWVLRAIEQVIFFCLGRPLSWASFAVFLILAGLYGYVWSAA